ncbi:hypothetical protein CY34DRAFT_803782 [Suillus luteus UH-Slu-Lm8-n1]|uniref:Secreted protein n=1 Tax=Suillus luteus UH-Slu-Lm8-n1 TaxID=930992 RepID=A0A0D0BJN1_9AGAM|nr:hypothetical protein CY34DRAFT_803782 [Suillus luteus UH-Slu-Lm8-n1]
MCSLMVALAIPVLMQTRSNSVPDIPVNCPLSYSCPSHHVVTPGESMIIIIILYPRGGDLDVLLQAGVRALLPWPILRVETGAGAVIENR